MKYLINHRKVISVTTLNKNLCGIVSNYVNYTINNLISILNNNDPKKVMIKIKNDMTLIDIIVLCVKLGCHGFFINDDKEHQNIRNLINRCYNEYKLNKSNGVKINMFSNNNKNHYFIKGYEIDNKCINVLSIGIFETVQI